MTATITKTCDVFISHSLGDDALAAELAERFDAVGMQSFHKGMVPPTADLGEAIWQAMAECRAVIVIALPDTAPSAIGMVEIGAAAAWEKPVYVLLNGPSTTHLPPALRKFPTYPLSRLEDVVFAIRRGIEPLSEAEHKILIGQYLAHGIPADELNQRPESLHAIQTKFVQATGKTYSEERLLSELHRLRKTGSLPKLPSRP